MFSISAISSNLRIDCLADDHRHGVEPGQPGRLQPPFARDQA